jgi:phosphonoacetate hydrolase
MGRKYLVLTSGEQHLSVLDRLLGEARQAAPDAAFLLTADHGMNYKKRCWDLAKACRERDLELRFALSAEKDRYVGTTAHSAARVGLAQSPADKEGAIETIYSLEGVEQVWTRAEAAQRFQLMPERIGDLVVIGDIDTVFGDLDTASEDLEAHYRSHGSLHESKVPLVIFNYTADLPDRELFSTNLDITRIPLGNWIVLPAAL